MYVSTYIHICNITIGYFLWYEYLFKFIARFKSVRCTISTRLLPKLQILGRKGSLKILHVTLLREAFYIATYHSNTITYSLAEDLSMYVLIKGVW